MNHIWYYLLHQALSFFLQHPSQVLSRSAMKKLSVLFALDILLVALLATPNAACAQAATDYRESSGTQGDQWHWSGPTPGELTDADRSVHNYQSSEWDRGSKNQTPQTRGGLPYARTAVESLQGSYGGMFGNTRLPSGKFHYGFNQQGYKPYMGTSWTQASPPSIGHFIPQTSTSSNDLNTVSPGKLPPSYLYLNVPWTNGLRVPDPGPFFRGGQ